jgi:predicted ribosome quality control (RQC) complex YloA/Tae2 family protein
MAENLRRSQRIDGKVTEGSRKTALSALDLAAVVCELNRVLPARVNAVHGLHSRAVSLELYHQSTGQTSLVLDSSGFMFLTQAVSKTVVRNSFLESCSQLKGAWLRSAEQVDFDRVVKLLFSNGYTLVLEVVGKGNLLLLSDEKIVSALSFLRVKDRAIEPGRLYRQPPARGKPLNEPADLKEGSLIQALTKTFNCPAELYEETLLELGVQPSKPVNEVGSEFVSSVNQRCLEIIARVNSCQLEPNLVYLGDVAIDVHPILFKRDLEKRVVEKSSFNQAVADFYEPLLSQRVSQESTKTSNEQVERLLASAKKNRVLAQQQLKKAEELRALGEHLSARPDLLEAVFKAVRQKKVEEVKQIVRTMGLEVERVNGLQLVLKRNGSVVELDPRQNAYSSIGSVYGEAKELERKAQEAFRFAEELEKQAESLETRVSAERVRFARLAVSRRKWFEKYKWFYTSKGGLVIAGRDASQNQAIVRKHAKQGYTALHADIQGAPLTLLMDQRDERSLLEAAQFAASHSKAWVAGLSVVDVFYADASQVSLTPPTGEFLPKGGVMFYEKKYLKGVSLGLALGFVRLDESEVRVNAWPRLVERGKPILFIEPGEDDKNKAAEKALKILASASDEFGAYAKTLRVDDILPLIPGPCRISRVNTGAPVQK